MTILSDGLTANRGNCVGTSEGRLSEDVNDPEAETWPKMLFVPENLES